MAEEIEVPTYKKRRSRWADDAPVVTDAFQRGIVDAPLATASRYLGNVTETASEITLGVGLGAQKFYYDGASAVNSLAGGVNTLLTGQEHRGVFDMGDNYWDFMSREFDLDIDSGVTTGAANMTAVLLSIQTGSKVLGSVPKVAQWMQAGGSAAKFGKAMLSSSLLGGAADLINTRSADSALVNLIPEEHQNDFTRWLSNREDDSELQGRMKNAIEGMAIGLVSDALFGAVGAILKGKKVPTGTTPEVQVAAEELAKDLTEAESKELQGVLKASKGGRVVFSPEESRRLSGQPPAPARHPLEAIEELPTVEMAGGNEAIRAIGNLGGDETQMFHFSHQAERVRVAWATDDPDKRKIATKLFDLVERANPELEGSDIQEMIKKLRGSEAGEKFSLKRTQPKKAKALSELRVEGGNEGIQQASELGASLRDKLHIARESERIRAAVESGVEDFNVGMQGLKKIIMEASDSATAEDAVSLAEAVMTGGSGEAIKSAYRSSPVGSIVEPISTAPRYLIGKLSADEARQRAG